MYDGSFKDVEHEKGPTSRPQLPGLKTEPFETKKLPPKFTARLDGATSTQSNKQHGPTYSKNEMRSALATSGKTTADAPGSITEMRYPQDLKMGETPARKTPHTSK